jgi:hypothetical protein
MRIATIFSSLSLSIYFLAVGVTAMLLGPFAVLHTLMTPLLLLQGLYGGSGGQFDLGRDLLALFSLWLTFFCIIDLSVLFSSMDLRDSVRVLAAARNYTKRIQFGWQKA